MSEGKDEAGAGGEASSGEPRSERRVAKPASLAARIGSDLGIRVASAAVMALIALGLSYAGLWPFAVLVAVICVVMSWEWARIVRARGIDAAMVTHGIAVLAAAVATAAAMPVAGLIAVMAGVAGVAVLQRGRQQPMSVAGVLYCGLPAIALIWLRSDAQYGWPAILFLFLIVWGTDTAAYFSGRLIGGAKLWPRVSPNKTWAGLGGGAMAGAAIGFAVAHWVGSGAPLIVALLGLLLALMAQLGDLGESALKRHYGVKDASALIPGHGGLLDRVDGLVVAAMVAGALALIIDRSEPGRALLMLH